MHEPRLRQARQSVGTVSHLKCYSAAVEVAIRELRNDTRTVIAAVERGEEVVLTRRGHPIARIVRIETDPEDLADWLATVTSGRDTGLFTETEQLRHGERDDDTDDRRLGLL